MKIRWVAFLLLLGAVAPNCGAQHVPVAGTSRMDAALALTVNFKPSMALAAATPVSPSDIDGTWMGAVEGETRTVHMVVKISETPEGLSAQWQLPDQGPMWFPATAVNRDAGKLTIEVKSLALSFEGKIAADLNSIDGTFTWVGAELPLTLKRSAE